VTSFGDLHEYVAIPRVTGLRLSPDGTWLAATVQQPDPDGKKYSSSIWRIPAGDGPGGPPPSGPSSQPIRLTQSAQGEDSPAFLPDGSLLFVSRRPDPAAGSADSAGGERDGAKPALWLLPAAGGDARRIAAPPGGASRIVSARGAPGLIFTSPLLPGVAGPEEDATPPAAQGCRRQRDPARGRAGPALGSRPGPRSAAAAGGHGRRRRAGRAAP
jgi:dipeptidyl aminopeptidase/acylaminoacyl peptidase